MYIYEQFYEEEELFEYLNARENVSMTFLMAVIL